MNDDERRTASGAKSPHRRALHAILVSCAIDDREPTEDDVRIELRRGGIEAQTPVDCPGPRRGCSRRSRTSRLQRKASSRKGGGT